MDNKKPTTKHQHYVPQVYLQGFSQNGKQIYRTEVDEKGKANRCVAIKSICYKDYLYEIQNTNGSYINPNLIEKIFCALEGMFGNYRKALCAKTFNKQNYHSKCFLTSEEKAFWSLYIVLQIVRDPEILSIAVSLSNKILPSTLTKPQCKMVAFESCIPFNGKLTAEDNNLFNALLKPIENMVFAVGFNPYDDFFTSEKPVYVEASNWEETQTYDLILFPIQSNIILYMFGGKYKEKCLKKHGKNVLLPLSKKDVVEIKQCLSRTFSKTILSKAELSTSDLGLIYATQEKIK